MISRASMNDEIGMAASSQLARFLAVHQMETYEALCAKAQTDPEWFWSAVIKHHQLHFFNPIRRVLDLSKGKEWAEWCVGGTTNISYNCLERTLAAGRGEHRAVIWESEDGNRRELTYNELCSLVDHAAAGLRQIGIGQGDVVALYMPMVPETVAAFLAILRIGAIALPLFSGFGEQAVAERLADAAAKAVITADF